MFRPYQPDADAPVHPSEQSGQMAYGSSQPTSSTINLPPISAIDPHNAAAMGVHLHPRYALHPPGAPLLDPPRQLPPLPYQQYPTQNVPQMPEYVTAARPVYHDPPGLPYSPHDGLPPLSSPMDPNISIIPSRHTGKTKEVKRRTKTGCLTCRRRRIKCDEGRPTCRNCAKSKRDCAGYDPVFQSSASATHHPVPTSDPSSSHENLHAHDHLDVSPIAITQTPYTTPGSTSNTTLTYPSDTGSYSYHRAAGPPPPHYAPGQAMGRQQHPTHPRSRMFVPKRTIEELCCIGGSRAPHVPPLPPDSTPNLESIQQIYDIAFAPGLDKFLETGPVRWFVSQGFSHLVADRGLLAQFLLYLTIVSNNFNPNQPENSATQSQEARITWALLNLVVKPAHDGNEEADKFSRRIKAVEALLTGEPLTIVKGSMADFIHSEDGVMDLDPAPTLQKDVSSALEKQFQRRSEEFWKCVEKFAECPRPPPESVDDPESPLNQARDLLDGLENRDLLYSMMLLCSSNGHDEHPGSRPVSRAGSVHGGNGNGNGNGHHLKEPALARRFLDSEYVDGRASNSVFATVAGLASRAFHRN